MTLILALGNKDYVVQISDRRLSNNGRLVDDESNKCGVVFCLNARLAFGYTGLARWNNFSTQKWLLQALHDSASPEFMIGEILERLKNNATETFKNIHTLKKCPNVHKRLAVMFSGYINLDGSEKLGCAVLSNYHNFENNTSFDEANEKFNVHYTSASEGVYDPTFLQRVGNWHGMLDDDICVLRELLLKHKPEQAVVGKAFEVVRDIADRPKSFGTIGKQLTSISILKYPNLGVRTDYSSNCLKQESYMPTMVYLKPNQHVTLENMIIRPVENTTPPLSVPKTFKNAPCPCGSKKKYKNCHARTSK